MNKGDTRANLYRMRARASSGTTEDAHTDALIGVALRELANDLPEAIVPDDEHVVLYEPIVSSDAAINARMAATADRHVMQVTTAVGGALPATTWEVTDGTWNGLMHLEIQDPNGQWHRRQSREWFRGSDAALYVSVDRRWRNATDTLMAFRIHQPEHFLRDDVIKVLQPAKIYSSNRSPVWSIDAAGYLRQDMFDYQGATSGTPERVARGRHFQMPAPTEAPTTTILNDVGGAGPLVWAGPTQEGTFTFRYTYAYGYRDVEWQEGESGTDIDPLWESAPSPASAAFDHGVAANNGFAVVIQATSIEAMKNFYVTGAPGPGSRHGRSGWYIILYVARSAIRTAGLGDAGFNRVETNSRYYRLGTLQPTAQVVWGAQSGGIPSFSWTGSLAPDYSRPMRDSTGYYAYHVYPHQDDRYELDLRVVRLPRDLVDDSDTLPIQNDAIPAFLELCLYYVALNDGVDQAGAQLHRDRYHRMLGGIRSVYSNPSGIVEPTPLAGYRRKFRYGAYSST